MSCNRLNCFGRDSKEKSLWRKQILVLPAKWNLKCYNSTCCENNQSLYTDSPLRVNKEPRWATNTISMCLSHSSDVALTPLPTQAQTQNLKSKDNLEGGLAGFSGPTELAFCFISTSTIYIMSAKHRTCKYNLSRRKWFVTNARETYFPKNVL